METGDTQVDEDLWRLLEKLADDKPVNVGKGGEEPEVKILRRSETVGNADSPSGLGTVVLGHWSWAIGLGTVVLGHWSWATGLGTLVSGHWSWDSGLGTLVLGHWSWDISLGTLVLGQ